MQPGSISPEKRYKTPSICSIEKLTIGKIVACSSKKISSKRLYKKLYDTINLTVREPFHGKDFK